MLAKLGLIAALALAADEPELAFLHEDENGDRHYAIISPHGYDGWSSRSPIGAKQIWTKTVLAVVDESGVHTATTEWRILCDDKAFMLSAIRYYDENGKQIGSDYHTGHHRRKNYDPYAVPSLISKVADIACDETSD